MKSIFAVLAVLTLTAGCATFQNTPQQDRTWAAYHVCRTNTGSNVVLQQVYPDGRYTWLASDRGVRVAEFEACMREEFAKRRATR